MGKDPESFPAVEGAAGTKDVKPPGPRKKLKYIIAGGSLALLVISTIAVALAAFSQSRELSLCDKIKQAKDEGLEQIEGHYNWLDVNLCRESSCSFDTDTCELECPFGYELDANDCPMSCDCVPDTRGTFQGDLQIDEEEMESYLTQFGYVDKSTEFALFADSSFESEQYLMKQYDRFGDIPNALPYVIDDDIDAKTKESILRVLDEVREILPCVTIKAMQEDLIERPYFRLQFVKKTGCWSGIARRGNMNEISLGVGCGEESTVRHMMYHRLGFHHEHSRSDRDNTVTINYDNMKRSRRYNFKKLKKGNVKDTNSRYDLTSIVQLDGMALSNNNKPTITEKATGQAVKADPTDFSPEDERELAYVYCGTEGNAASSVSSSTSSSYSPPSSSGYSPPSSSPSPSSSFSTGSSFGSSTGSSTGSSYGSSTGSSYTGSSFSSTGVVSTSFGSSSGSISSISTENDDCDDSGWAPWGPYGPCSVTCGQGYKTANRKCPASNSCPGGATLETICSKPACSTTSSSWYTPSGSSSTSTSSSWPSPSYSPPSISFNPWSSSTSTSSSTSSSSSSSPWWTPPSSTSSSSYGSSSSSSSSTPSSPSWWQTPTSSSSSSNYGSSSTSSSSSSSSTPSSSSWWQTPSSSSSSSGYGSSSPSSSSSSSSTSWWQTPPSSSYGSSSTSSSSPSSSSWWPSTSSSSSTSSGSSSSGSSSTSSTSSPYGNLPFAVAWPKPSSSSSNPWSPPTFAPSSSSFSSSNFKPYTPPSSPWGSSTSYGKSAGRTQSTIPFSFSGRTREGKWSPWGQYGRCSSSCGGGLKHRTRQCQPEGHCSGRSKMAHPCFEDLC